MFLQKEMNALKQWAEQDNIDNSAVSKSGTHWHIDHSLRTIYGILKLVADSDPSEYKWSFNKTRAIIYTLNYIPRGKAKAPKAVTAVDAIDQAEMLKLFAKVEKKLASIPEISKNQFFKHPYFGLLNKKSALKMIRLHTKHHLKIIKDIAQ